MAHENASSFVAVRRRPANLTYAPGISLVWAAASLATIFVILDLTLIVPNDFWWHLRAGELIVAGGSVPATDLFSFTQAGQPWIFQSWLSEVILFRLYAAGGAPLVIFAHSLVVTAAYTVLLIIARQNCGGNLRLAAVAVFAAVLLGIGNWNVRPQTFSFLLFALTLFLLERYRRQGGHWLWLLAPIMTLWANLHGAFIFGLLLVALFVLARMWTFWRNRGAIPPAILLRETGAAGLAGLAVFLTPIGPGMAGYVLGFLQHDVTQKLNVEFQAASIRLPNGAALLAICLLLFLLMLRSTYRPALVEGLRLLAFGFLAFLAVRSIPWFGFVVAPVLAAALAAWMPGQRAASGRHPVNVLLAAGLFSLALLSLPWLRPRLPLPEERRSFLTAETPVAATARLCQSAAGPVRLFAELGFASYVEWACPDAKVFVDTRIEQYPVEQWRDYLNVSAGRYDWEETLDRYGVTHLMLRRKTQESLIAAANQSVCWRELHHDDYSVLFEARQEPPCVAAPQSD